jgi:hypothetical protein
MGDIEDAARTAEAALAKLAGSPPPVRVVVSLPGRVAETASLDEAFGGLLDTRDLPLIQSLKIDIGEAQTRLVVIHCETLSPAVTLEAVADDRTEVEGLMGRLEPYLDRGRQRLGEGAVYITLGGAVAASAVAITLIGANLGLIQESGTPGGSDVRVSPALIVAAVVVPVLVYFVGRRLLPALQLLGPGGQPIVARFRTAVVLFVLSVVGSVVASWLYATFFV